MEREEVQNVEKDFKIALGMMRKEAAEVTEAFLNFLRCVRKEGTLSIKQKELISLGIALYAKCEPCIILHTKSAIDARATREELMETYEIALMMGGSPVAGYASVFLKALEKFSQRSRST